jgi:hypothetical protein
MKRAGLGLRAQLEAERTPAIDAAISQSHAQRGGRAGKKALIAYFSPELSRSIRQIALDENTTMQALLGEAVDLLMRSRGKHPFGER